MELIYVISETKEQCLSLVSDLTAEVLQRRHRFQSNNYGSEMRSFIITGGSHLDVKASLFQSFRSQFQCCPAPQTMLNNCFFSE